MSLVSFETVSEIIKECAGKYILPRYKKLQQHEVSSKTSPRDLVTQADLDTEAHLIKVLPDLLPGSVVIGEEGASADPALLKQLINTYLDLWVVDPVDGTHNFVHHKREFGVMLALVSGGEVRQSWIYDILGEEMTVAEKGGGAYSNGQKLHVKHFDDTREMRGHINPWFFSKQYRGQVQDAQKHFAECRSMACAAHEYLRVARGDAQFSLYSRLKPWDHLAGTLTVEEAGGYTAKWDGTPYQPSDHHVGLITASDKETWKTVRKIFGLDQ